MASHTEGLLQLIDADGRFDIPYAELRERQIAAADQLFHERIGRISLLGHRASEAGLSGIRELGDIVPLLFAHTTYKSYPEGWLVQNKWDRMQRWLETVSTYAITGADFDGIGDIDDWLARLEAAGTYVSCSSGTTGKCSMIAATSRDRAFAKRNTALAFEWSTRLDADRSFKVIAAVPVPSSPRNRDVRAAISEAYGDGDDFTFPGAPITIGQISRMVALRRAVADGSAPPDDLADYERIAAARQKDIEQGSAATIDALIANRGHKILISGQFAMLYQIAEQVRALGYGAKDFDPGNALFVGGGLKGAMLPPDFREYIFDTFNLTLDRTYQYYGMQEINTTMPRCAAGRYHVPPWLILLLLDDGGDALLPPSDGEAEGRAGFFDLSLDGRWGGIISGDKIKVRYGRCDCGHEGPTVGQDIVRYSDLGDGDKITCAGTIDAYVRGVS